MKKYKIILIISLVFFIINSNCLANITNNKTPRINNIKTAQINKNMTREQKKKVFEKYLQDMGYNEFLETNMSENINWNKVENDLPIYFYQAIYINSNLEENGWNNFHIHIPPYAHNEKEMQKYINIINILQTNKKICSLWLINQEFYKYSELYDQVYQNPKIKNKEKAFLNEVKKYNRQEDWKHTKEYIYYITMPVWIIPAVIFGH